MFVHLDPGGSRPEAPTCGCSGVLLELIASYGCGLAGRDRLGLALLKLLGSWGPCERDVVQLD